MTKATTPTTPTTTQTPTATSTTATTSTTQSTNKDTPSILNKIKNSDKGQIVGALTGILHVLTGTTSVDYRGHGHNAPPSHASSGCAIAVCSLVEGIKGRGMAAGEAATIAAGAATTPEGVGIPVLAGSAMTAAGTALCVKGVMEAKTAAQIIPNAMALSSSKGNQPSQSNTSRRPTEKNPKSELPNTGTRPYVPPKQIGVGPNDIVKESAR